MELLLLFVVIGFLTRGTWDHAKANRAASRDQRMKEVAKSYPKGALPKSRQRAAARQHAAGWWAREVRHGFPVTKTGWHAAWLAHQTAADHHKARREEARTTALETRASVLAGMPGHRERQAAAQAELDKIEKELAAQQAKGSPATGRKAARQAADEVARRREQKVMVTDVCPSCSAPDGYEHLKGCPRSTPPLPADSVRPASPAVIDTPVRVQDPHGDAERRHAEIDDAVTGADHGFEGEHDTHPSPTTQGAPVTDADEAAWTLSPGVRGLVAGPWSTPRDPDEPGRDASRNPQPVSSDGTSTTTTNGATMTADTNYTRVLTTAQAQAQQADEDAANARRRRETAEQHAEEMQAAEVDGATLSAQMDLVDRLRASERAATETVEHATALAGGLQQRHGGLKSAHDDAPVRAAQRGFYEE